MSHAGEWVEGQWFGPEQPVQILVTYGIGEVEEDFMALIFRYATGQKRYERQELDQFVIGIPRELAIELGQALIKRAKAPPSRKRPPPRQ
jgi:hypothetical protein